MHPRPLAESTAYTRTLQRAADTLGGPALLARALSVPLADLKRWLAGESRPPQDIFLAALDIVSDGSPQRRVDRSQRVADRAQATANRAQAAADRAQASADRAQRQADRTRAQAHPEDDKLRTMRTDEQGPASNASGEKQEKEG